MPTASRINSDRFEAPKLLSEQAIRFVHKMYASKIFDARLLRTKLSAGQTTVSMFGCRLPYLTRKLDFVCFRSHRSDSFVTKGTSSTFDALLIFIDASLYVSQHPRSVPVLNNFTIFSRIINKSFT